MRVFAGPNGSGKTTIFKQIAEKFDIGYYVNADEIEVELLTSGKVRLDPYDLANLKKMNLKIFKKVILFIEKQRKQASY